MNGTDYLVDTNILIHLGNGHQAVTEFLQDKTVFISFISEIELLSKPASNVTASRLLQSLLDDCIIIDIDQHIKKETIKIRRLHRLKMPDAIIAASARRWNLP